MLRFAIYVLGLALVAWTQRVGEGCCEQCGSPYLMTEVTNGEVAPRLLLEPGGLSLRTCQAYWQETQKKNGLGHWVPLDDYPEKEADQMAFHNWCEGKGRPFPEEAP